MAFGPVLARFLRNWPEGTDPWTGSGACLLQPALWGAILIAAALSGCGLDRYEKAYQEAQVRPDLRIPEDLRAEGLREAMELPQISDAASVVREASELVRPLALVAPETRDKMRVQTLGQRSWLISPQTPSQAWPKLLRFLAINGVDVALNSPGGGILHTQWLTLPESEQARAPDVTPASPGAVEDRAQSEGGIEEGGADRAQSEGGTTRGGGIEAQESESPEHDGSILGILRHVGVSEKGLHQLQFRVEQALREDFAEIHVRHLHANDVAESSEVMEWPELSAEPAVESPLLLALGEFILSQGIQDEISLKAQQIEAGPKLVIEIDSSGEPRMMLRLDQARVNAMLRRSLREAGIPTQESPDAFTQILLDEKSLSEKQPGFWDDLLRQEGVLPGTLELHLESQEDRFFLWVRDLENAPVKPALAERILQVIREFAS